MEQYVAVAVMEQDVEVVEMEDVSVMIIILIEILHRVIDLEGLAVEM